MNMLSSSILLVSLISIAASAPVNAGTYYLSPSGSDTAGNGSRQNPWKTIKSATGRIPDDGSHVVLLDGLYDGWHEVPRQFAQGCTVRAEHPYRARLSGGPGQNHALSLYQAANITFRGLEICGSGGTRNEYLIHITSPRTHHVTFEDCIIHDCYNNDMIKINDRTHHVLFRKCVFFNQTDHEGDQQFDINSATDVSIEDCIFFNDYAGSGRRSANRSQGFIVVKNSRGEPEVMRRVALRRSIFLNWDGAPTKRSSFSVRTASRSSRPSRC